MWYKAYILKTVIYRIDINAKSKRAAGRILEDKLTDGLNSKPEAEYLETIDSWWDYDSIEIEECLSPEGNILRRGIEIDFDTEV
mgnify:CR=1 FL=1